MKQELIKPIVRVGNSAGVILPKNWIDGTAKIKLIQKPLDIEKDILKILGPYLKDIVGIYLIGSYARGEQTERSDVDVLVITENKNEKITKGRYNILLISQKKLEDSVKTFALPMIPMIKEAKPIMNKKLIEEYRKKIKLSKKNLKWYLDITKLGIELSKASIIVDKERDSKYCSDAVSYSLVLNLRSTYIVGCIKKKQKWSTAGLLSLIKEVSGSLEAYKGYLRVKNDEKTKETIPIEEAEKLLNHISKKLKEHEKWAKAKKE